MVLEGMHRQCAAYGERASRQRRGGGATYRLRARREEYLWLREMAQRYGSGFVVNIQPVKSCDQAIAKYVAKQSGRREKRDKGTRLTCQFDPSWQVAVMSAAQLQQELSKLTSEEKRPAASGVKTKF